MASDVSNLCPCLPKKRKPVGIPSKTKAPLEMPGGFGRLRYRARAPVPSPRSQAPNLTARLRGAWDLGAWDLGPGTWDLEPGTWNLGLRTHCCYMLRLHDPWG